MSDREHLLHLADRARRGVALPAEHDALAAGIGQLADRVEFTEAAHARMRDRAEVADVRATARIAALVQRAEQTEAELTRITEGESADAAAGSYALRAEKAEAALEQAELDAEQQARHFRTVCGERESYRQAWKDEQKRRATAEAAIARVRALCDRYQTWHEGGWAPADAALVAREYRAALDAQPTT